MYKIDKLLKLERKIFHIADLGLLWEITNKNTLYTTIKRYRKRGVLIPIHKGFYTTVPLSQIDPVSLGAGFLHRFAYLSTESVLAQDGVISQIPQAITLVSPVSKKFTIGNFSFLSRRLKPKFLYQTVEIEDKNGVFVASLERAVADMLYFNPQYYFDNPKLVNWQKVKSIQKEMGYP
ncbi:hypothetical protein HZB97_03425 [Candidatus Gottesmanbacteria bacterium]|nr:hypothetical protein [Candidatus Gottesmanbacteria bacterium]MBI5465284.1 hypothetical protein [Candidatus Gottesmanbacteria bacterium]